jgi:hypothetical protein
MVWMCSWKPHVSTHAWFRASRKSQTPFGSHARDWAKSSQMDRTQHQERHGADSERRERISDKVPQVDCNQQLGQFNPGMSRRQIMENEKFPAGSAASQDSTMFSWQNNPAYHATHAELSNLTRRWPRRDWHFQMGRSENEECYHRDGRWYITRLIEN